MSSSSYPFFLPDHPSLWVLWWMPKKVSFLYNNLSLYWIFLLLPGINSVYLSYDSLVSLIGWWILLSLSSTRWCRITIVEKKSILICISSSRDIFAMIIWRLKKLFWSLCRFHVLLRIPWSLNVYFLWSNWFCCHNICC